MTEEEAKKNMYDSIARHSEMLMLPINDAGVMYHKNIISAYQMGIEALEKQIPKKPKIEYWENRVPSERKVFVCPNCDYFLSDYAFIGDGKKVTYCETCGQAIDWSDIE